MARQVTHLDLYPTLNKMRDEYVHMRTMEIRWRKEYEEQLTLGEKKESSERIDILDKKIDELDFLLGM